MVIEKIIPQADSLIESLRDIGYTTETAIADIIDNSITAKAEDIDIRFEFNGALESYIAILDNGTGMTKEKLIAAMRPGSQNPNDKRDKKDLGRFGLGLKTASFSQCRRLTVITKKDGIVSGASWDLDFVSKKREWLLQILDFAEISAIPTFQHLQNNGTLVLWEKIDRILESSDHTTMEQALYRKMGNVKKHLELIFHRFLSGKEKSIPTIQISINDAVLEPFNPFNEFNPATIIMPEEKITLNNEIIKIQPYILAHHSKIKRSEYEKYGGEGGYLNTQGFYVYRNGRLLISGTWFRLIPKSPLTQLARIKIDLPNNMDNLWKIDVKKSMASPPPAIRKRLKKIIEKIAGNSMRVYTKRGSRKSKSGTPLWTRNAKHGSIRYEINMEHPMISQFAKSLEKEKQKQFQGILRMISNFFPRDSFFSDFAKDPDKIISDDETIKKDVLKMAKEFYYLILKSSGKSKEEMLRTLLATEPFSGYPDLWDGFLDKMEKK